jgi:hypothetical protein
MSFQNKEKDIFILENINGIIKGNEITTLLSKTEWENMITKWKL